MGPALAGFLIYAVGIGGCFLINGLSFLAVIVAYVMMRFERRPRLRATGGHWGDLREGIRYVRSHETVRTAVNLIITASFFTFSYATLLPVFASDVLGGDAAIFAGLMTAVGAGALISGLAVASLGNHRRKGLLASVGVIWFPLSLMVLSFARSRPVATAVCFMLGLGMILLTASMNTLVQSSISDRFRGRVMSLYVLVFLGPLPFGNLLAGRLAEALGVIPTIRLGAAISLVVSIIILSRHHNFTRFES
jgi:predicted MFS family arabinose efflux permease